MWTVQGFLTSSIISFANQDNFTSFPTSVVCLLFIFVIFLIALARISSRVLNSSAGSRHPSFVPDLGGNALGEKNISPLSILAVGFSYMAFTVLGTFPSLPRLS